MERKQNAFYTFLSLTRGDWRNALYIECKRPCRKNCKGFFLISDTEGVPLIYPVSLFENKSKTIIDKTECAGILSRSAFESIYNRWLIWNITDKSRCSIEQLQMNLPYDFAQYA